MSPAGMPFVDDDDDDDENEEQSMFVEQYPIPESLTDTAIKKEGVEDVQYPAAAVQYGIVHSSPEETNHVAVDPGQDVGQDVAQDVARELDGWNDFNDDAADIDPDVKPDPGEHEPAAVAADDDNKSPQDEPQNESPAGPAPEPLPTIETALPSDPSPNIQHLSLGQGQADQHRQDSGEQCGGQQQHQQGRQQQQQQQQQDSRIEDPYDSQHIVDPTAPPSSNNNNHLLPLSSSSQPPPPPQWPNLKLVITSGSPAITSTAVKTSKSLLTRLALRLQQLAEHGQVQGEPEFSVTVRRLQDRARTPPNATSCPELTILEANLHTVTQQADMVGRKLEMQERTCENLQQEYDEVQIDLKDAKVLLDVAADQCWSFMSSGPSQHPQESGESTQQPESQSESQSENQSEDGQEQSPRKKRKLEAALILREAQREDKAEKLALDLREHMGHHDMLTQQEAELHATLDKAEDQAAFLECQRDALVIKRDAMRSRLDSEVALQHDRTLLQDLLQLLMPLSAWAINLPPSVPGVLDDVRISQMNAAFCELDYHVCCAVEGLKRTLHDITGEEMANLHALVQESQRAAPAVAAVWSGPVTDGGVTATVYRSVCSSRGDGSNTATGRNFNRELLGEVLTKMEPVWTAILAARVPEAISSCNNTVENIVTSFCQHIMVLLGYSSGSQGRLETPPPPVQTQVKQLQEAIASAVETRVLACYHRQSRILLNEFRTAMAPCYEECARQVGGNCRKSMGSIMDKYLRENGVKAFGDVEVAVQKDLTTTLGAISEDLKRECVTRLTRIVKMYFSIAPAEPESARRARLLLQKLLATTDKAFSMSVLKMMAAGQADGQASGPSLEEADGEEQ